MNAENETWIRSIPSWDNPLFGTQTGILVSLFSIFVIGLIIRSIVIFLLPHLFSPIAKRSESVDDFELRSRISFGASAAGLVWWRFNELLRKIAESDDMIHYPEILAFWVSSLAQAVFLIGLIIGLMRLVDLVQHAVKYWDKDGTLDGTERTLITAVESALRFTILIGGVVLLAEAFGFDLKTLLAGLGVGGLAIAFAAKDTVGNLFGSVTLLLDRPFRIGDWIRVGSAEGEVIEIGIRTTQLRTSQDTIITLPNGSLVNKDIENFGKRRWRRYLPTFYLDLSSPASKLDKFCRGIEDLIHSHPQTQKKEDSYAHISVISKDSFEVGCNLYWDVEGGLEEKEAREKFLLDVTRLAEKCNLDFFEPRRRTTNLGPSNESE